MQRLANSVQWIEHKTVGKMFEAAGWLGFLSLTNSGKEKLISNHY